MAALNATAFLLPPLGAPPAPQPPPTITLAGVAFTAALVLADAVVSVLLGLNLHWQLATGVVRCVGWKFVCGS